MGFLFFLTGMLGISAVIQNDDSLSDREDDPPSNGENIPEVVDFSEPLDTILPTPDALPDTISPLNLQGTNDADTLTGGIGNDTINGADGSDQLKGLAGNDQLVGGNGFDLILGDVGDDTLWGGDGGDTLGGGVGQDLAFGSAGDDVVSGSIGADTLSGGDGDDELFGDSQQVGTSSGLDGADLIEGGAGNDSIYGGGGIDTLIGGDGNDLIRDFDLSGNEGVDNGSVVDGGAGNDHIRVDGASTITGGSGDDTFYLHADIGLEGVTEITDFVQGEDQLAFDIVLNESDTGLLSIQDMADGTGAQVHMADVLVAEITGAQGLALTDLNANLIIAQNAGSVDYTGTDSDELIVGNHSDNVINGEGGNDSLFAGTGNGYHLSNWNNYHGGSDVLNGGAGDDYIVAIGGGYGMFNDGSSPIEVQRNLHVDTLNGGEGNDTLIATNGGNLTGGEGEDVFIINQNMRYIDDDTYAGDDLTPDPIIITDYNPDEDVIVIDRLGDFAGFSGPPSDQVTVQARQDGEGSDILISGNVIATVVGVGDLTYADLSFEHAVALS